MGGRAAEGAARLERVLLAGAVLGLFAVGYYAVGWSGDLARARSLATAWDARIPFVPASVWIYAQAYPGALLPVFVIRSRAVFRRVAFAYVVTIVVSLLCFVVVPVSAVGLRVRPEALDTGSVSGWAVAWLYRLDPPLNLFPSLHLALVVLAAAAIWKVWPGLGAGVAAAALGLAAAVCTVKQHFLVDALAGAALAGAVSAVWILPLRVPRAAPAWRGLARFALLELVLHAVVLGGFRAGL